MNKTTMLPITLVILVMGITAMQYMLHQQAKASIAGNYGQGYDDGKNAAKANFPSSDASCPRDFLNNISYCTGYHTGFDIEFVALQQAGGK